MRIAVASQNFRTITGHAGKTRRFLVYEAAPSAPVIEVDRLDLPKDMSMHEFHGEGAHPLDAMKAVIAGSAGQGFTARMAARGVLAVVTDETDPLLAVQALVEALAQMKEAPIPDLRGAASGHHHHHHHDHGTGGCGCSHDEADHGSEHAGGGCSCNH
ncbi:NifB/NifX family molybdenum-iron cluster-binding protein [Rhodobacter maris]|uniref:Dinitrogenase iron-molybdenum cofactor n=1 Tax=Rhodobacter maris TaxID=446682 RepID=A0A285RFZ9_9RHOB|nr:NifB/NifX family molybdenum-iron cluster-binding protein [Rhodobacter maris]SOB93055.1 dinitrogenase iron-molybdenum cofactor [Rhodobacter maris]